MQVRCSTLIFQFACSVSEIELLDYRKKVLHYLRELRASWIVERAGPLPPDPHVKICLRDEHEVKYWHKGLQDLNEVIHRNANDPQSQGTNIIRYDESMIPSTLRVNVSSGMITFANLALILT